MQRLALAASIAVIWGQYLQVFADNAEEVQEEWDLIEDDEDEDDDYDEYGHSQGHATSTLDEFDEDGDGKVSLDEIKAALLTSLQGENAQVSEQALEDETVRQRFVNTTVPTLFWQVDDGDGLLSEDEILVFLDRVDAYDESVAERGEGEL
eukprot:TRINITY_DN7374_c0_g4_i2.p1 TRINITY_DN7374_c0_g4~~TRINITY_DN7374_c0_g4_i2.p1  ORF type:complete len:151 (-),score=40.60 TRINITY_DN7374_c0_g4_i2:19-471(-)